jgi:hypothetical protein
MILCRNSVVLFILAFFVGVCLLSKAQADELQVAYKTFYSHVKKLNSEDTNALQFAFGFMNIRTQTLCEISSAKISTQKKQIPLVVSPEYRFTLPSEKALRLANAVVILELSEPSNICDISVQLETKAEFVKTRYTEQELTLLYQQYVSFFDDVGGFMSFMMPKVDGLTIQFTNKGLNETLSNGMLIEKGTLVVASDRLAALAQVSFPNMPLRITAKTTK